MLEKSLVTAAENTSATNDDLAVKETATPVTRPPDADLPGAPNIIDELTPPIRLQSFRDPFGVRSIPRIDRQTASSCNIALSKLRSATSHLSLPFSSSS